MKINVYLKLREVFFLDLEYYRILFLIIVVYLMKL